MSPCSECGSNEWWFKKDAGVTVATCKKCKEQIRFSASKVKGHKCKCGRIMEVVTIKPTKEDLHKEFYYSGMYKCPRCGATEIKEDTKILNH